MDLPYWIYGVMSLLAAVFVYFYIPETKQRTLEDIQNLWSHERPSGLRGILGCAVEARRQLPDAAA